METVTITFESLTIAQAQNLLAAIKCDYSGPAPAVLGDTAKIEAYAAQQSIPASVGGFMSEGVADVIDNSVEREAAVVATKRGRKPKAQAAEPELRPAAPTIDDVRAALAAVLEKDGMPACQKLLADFGATRIGDLAEPIYALFVAAARERAS